MEMLCGRVRLYKVLPALIVPLTLLDAVLISLVTKTDKLAELILFAAITVPMGSVVPGGMIMGVPFWMGKLAIVPASR